MSQTSGEPPAMEPPRVDDEVDGTTVFLLSFFSFFSFFLSFLLFPFFFFFFFCPQDFYQGGEQDGMDTEESSMILQYLASGFSPVLAVKDSTFILSLRGKPFANEKEKRATAEKLRRWTRNYELKKVDVRF